MFKLVIPRQSGIQIIVNFGRASPEVHHYQLSQDWCSGLGGKDVQRNCGQTDGRTDKQTDERRITTDHKTSP